MRTSENIPITPCGLSRRRPPAASPRPLASGRAFTLVELLVSIAILALVLVMVGLIFSMSTKATGLAQANNDNLNNLRALVKIGRAHV